mgnify:CR=1 FL=1
MNNQEIQKKILEEEDYIKCPKNGNSIKKFISKNPEGVENYTIAKLLLMSEKKVEELYNEAIEILKKYMAK